MEIKIMWVFGYRTIMPIKSDCYFKIVIKIKCFNKVSQSKIKKSRTMSIINLCQPCCKHFMTAKDINKRGSSHPAENRFSWAKIQTNPKSFKTCRSAL